MTPAPATMIPPPPQAVPGQTLYEYGLACLSYVVDHGTARLDQEQLRQADAAAQAYASRVRHQDEKAQTGVLEPHQYAVLETFNRARHQIAAAQAGRRRQLVQAQRLLDELYQPSEADPTLDQDGDQAPEPTAQERAVRLMRAALTLIMGPQDGGSSNGGGRPAPLVPPRPTKPNQGTTLQVPRPTRNRDDDGIAF